MALKQFSAGKYQGGSRTVLVPRAWLCVGLLASLPLWTGCGKPPPIQEITATARSGERPTVELATVTPGDWPWWRGTRQDGQADGKGVPLTWSETENIVWKADVPGRGHSSPTVRGQHVFVSTADEQAKVQSLLCFDRDSGERLWQTEIHRDHFDHMHEKNSQASPTPACDGGRVFVSFLNNHGIWVSAVGLDGKLQWQKEAGPFSTVHGYAASPVLYQSFVIVAGDSNGQSFLAGLNRDDGEIAWRIQRPQKTSFSSPMVAQIAGRDQLLITGGKKIASYDPATGKELWTCAGLTDTTAGTVTAAGDKVYASGGYPGAETICVRADGSGDVSSSHVVWRVKEKVYVPSLLVHDGLLYAVNDGGIALCWEADTGKEVWKKRLGGDVSASLVRIGEHLLVPNEAGQVYVLKTGREYQLVGENDLGDGGFATPVVAGNRLFLRTNHRLYCIGAK